jgi:hypothetical protein
MRRVALYFAILILCLSRTLSRAGNGFFSGWLTMMSETQSESPHGVSAPATTTPRETVAETEVNFTRYPQSDRAGTRSGGGKGLRQYLRETQVQ